MNLNIVSMKTWQSRVLNATAWLIGIRGEDVWCVTLTKGAVDKVKKTKESFTGTAYCVKCKVNKEFTGWVRTSDSGRKMAQGNCPTCNTKLNRILGKKN